MKIHISALILAFAVSAQDFATASTEADIVGSWLIHRDIGCDGSYDFSFRIDLSQSSAWNAKEWKMGSQRDNGMPLYWKVSGEKVSMYWAQANSRGEGSHGYVGSVITGNEMRMKEVNGSQKACVKALRYVKGKCNFLPDRASCQVEQPKP